MVSLLLNKEEEQMLRDVLIHSLADLEKEIIHTDHHAFRDYLKQRKTLLEQLTQKLPHSEDVSPQI